MDSRYLEVQGTLIYFEISVPRHIRFAEVRKNNTFHKLICKRLNHFHTSCLRKLLKIKWQDRIPDTEVLKRAGMQSVHTLLKLTQYDGQAMLPECLMYVCQRESSMENYKLENASMVVRRSDTRTPSKPPLTISTYQQSRGNRLHRIEQSGEAS